MKNWHVVAFPAALAIAGGSLIFGQYHMQPRLICGRSVFDYQYSPLNRAYLSYQTPDWRSRPINNGYAAAGKIRYYFGGNFVQQDIPGRKYRFYSCSMLVDGAADENALASTLTRAVAQHEAVRFSYQNGHFYAELLEK